jgi:hypothetical protein
VVFETTKLPKVSWADIAVSGNRCPSSDGGVKEKEADKQEYTDELRR